MTQVHLQEKPKPLQPDGKESFGHVLWCIIGSQAPALAEAARRLAVTPHTLDSILHGRRQISQKALAEKNWRGVLAAYYPDAWPQYQAAFERHAVALPNGPGVKSCQPRDAKSFGFTVWLIIGGETANVKAAAQRLGIHPNSLSSILHGRHQISQKTMAERNWRGVFATHYPSAWLLHQAAFEQRAKRMRIAAGNRHPPKNKESFGYTVWLILGGKTANLTAAARRLLVHPATFSNILHGRQRISRQALAKKNWRGVFAAHYPGTWSQHQTAFERHAARLMEKTGAKSHQPDDKESFGCAVWHIIGGEHADMREAARRLGVTPSTLSKILHGQKRISQQALMEKNWRGVFATHYPGTWPLHRAIFEQRANKG